MPKFIDLTDKRYNKFIVIKFHEFRNLKTFWMCKCDCGKEISVRADSLKEGKIKSCGCWSFEKERYNPSFVLKEIYNIKEASESREYKTWKNIKERCYNKKCKHYHSYGGRDIKVCDKWIENFQAFYEDMGLKPKGKSLDRIDNNGDYSPENCRWATPKEQCNNKRFNVHLTINGETKTITEWSRITGVIFATILTRHRRGLSPEECISTKSFTRNHKLKSNTTSISKRIRKDYESSNQCNN